jgi:hypothetical protein
LQDRHWVDVHRRRQAGHTPPVSKVFHSCPQLQDHRSSWRGDQPQIGHRMRGPPGRWVCSCSSLGSRTTEDFTESAGIVRSPPHYDPRRSAGGVAAAVYATTSRRASSHDPRRIGSFKPNTKLDSVWKIEDHCTGMSLRASRLDRVPARRLSVPRFAQPSCEEALRLSDWLAAQPESLPFGLYQSVLARFDSSFLFLPRI